MKPGHYRHYKGYNYFVVGTVRHSENEEELVLYFPLYGDDPCYWVRPVAMFCESVMINGLPKPRFEFIRQASTAELNALRGAGPDGLARNGSEQKNIS